MAGSPLLTRARNRLKRLRQHRWRMAPYASGERHIVMGGAPRSGTTVLRRLFDRHPEICSGAETKLFVPAAFNLAWLAQAYDIPLADMTAMRDSASSQAAFIDAFAARVRNHTGKARWAEKTPQNIRHLEWISERFPHVSIIHIIRDGRDASSSHMHKPWLRAEDAWSGQREPGCYLHGPWPSFWVEPERRDEFLRTSDAKRMAWAWRRYTEAGLRDGPPLGAERYHELRYEDLVRQPVDEAELLQTVESLT